MNNTFGKGVNRDPHIVKTTRRKGESNVSRMLKELRAQASGLYYNSQK